VANLDFAGGGVKTSRESWNRWVGKGVARRKAREPCPRAAPLDRVGTARRGIAALAPLPTLQTLLTK